MGQISTNFKINTTGTPINVPHCAVSTINPNIYNGIQLMYSDGTLYWTEKFMPKLQINTKKRTDNGQSGEYKKYNKDASVTVTVSTIPRAFIKVAGVYRIQVNGVVKSSTGSAVTFVFGGKSEGSLSVTAYDANAVDRNYSAGSFSYNSTNTHWRYKVNPYPHVLGPFSV